MPHFYGAVGAPNVGHHQWQPHSRRRLIRGDGSCRRAARMFLQEMRWRRPAPEYGLRATAVVLALLVHVVAVLLGMVHSPRYAPPAGEPAQATVEVRLIEKPEPPPPPPPIRMPERRKPVKKQPATPVPPSVKRAPVAAMPPIPQVTPARPDIKLAPARPEVAEVQPQPQPVQQAAASPPAPEPVPEVTLSPAPPRVVLEKSTMAIAPPPVGEVQVAPARVPSPGLQPVPTRHAAPTVRLGNPALAEVQAGELQDVTQPAVRARASMPQVPDAGVARPEIRIEQAPAPSIRMPEATAPALSAPEAALAPIPQAPETASAAPALDLPVARVPEPQAPAAVQAPSIRVDTSAVAEPTSAEPASATSAARSTSSSVATSESWAPANDQFKPVTGRHGKSGTPAGDQTGGKKGYVQLLPQGNSDVMSRSSDHLGYEPTIFDQYWAPEGESILDTFLRRVIEKLTVKHTFHVAPGVRVHCVLGPMAIFLSCGGDPPRKGSSKSDDPRLNMAPARSLVPDLAAPAPASTAPAFRLDSKASCATARVAGSPPPPGCPGAPVGPSQSDQWNPDDG